MRRILFFILLLLGWQDSYAQNGLRTKLNDVFTNIDKSKVPSGFLEEYGTPFVPLDVFNGVLSDSN